MRIRLTNHLTTFATIQANRLPEAIVIFVPNNLSTVPMNTKAVNSIYCLKLHLMNSGIHEWWESLASMQNRCIFDKVMIFKAGFWEQFYERIPFNTGKDFSFCVKSFLIMLFSAIFWMKTWVQLISTEMTCIMFIFLSHFFISRCFDGNIINLSNP